MLGGPYRRVRLPLGLGAGREFGLGERASVLPFFQSAAVLEYEQYRPHNRAEQTRSGLGLALSGGLALTYDWFVLRSTLSHTLAKDYTLTEQHNWPVFSLHAGVKF